MTTAVMGIAPPHLSSVRQEQASARLAWFLAGAYPGGSKRKRIAIDYGVSEETAKAWLNGRAFPNTVNIVAMGRRYGAPFVNFVFGGEVLTPREMEIQMQGSERQDARMVKEGEQERVRGETALLIEALALAIDRRNSAKGRKGSRLDDPGAAQAYPRSLTPGEEGER